MKLPNFFILGAPKCGTTSMAEWLSKHPEIFMTEAKEPHYYNKDINHNSVVNYKHYLSLFKKATSQHKVVGEASVWYLYSKEAVPNILKDVKDDRLKFLVMLRNPIKMAYSLHEQHVFNLNEPEKDFKVAWNLQEDRKIGKKTALTTRDPKLLLYGETCKLGEQVQRLLTYVNRNQVFFVVMDDLKNDPLYVYKQVLAFLDVAYDGRTDFKAVNTAKVRKSEFIALIVKLLGKLKYKLKITKGFGLLNKTNANNLKNISRPPLDMEMEEVLKEYFKDDILLLSRLIGRDLSNWIR